YRMTIDVSEKDECSKLLSLQSHAQGGFEKRPTGVTPIYLRTICQTLLQYATFIH
ncbi:hypothetical protein J6590_102634, partial [Homalodisca vitripennis]